MGYLRHLSMYLLRNAVGPARKCVAELTLFGFQRRSSSSGLRVFVVGLMRVVERRGLSRLLRRRLLCWRDSGPEPTNEGGRRADGRGKNEASGALSRCT
jgi:hypothetical protein